MPTITELTTTVLQPCVIGPCIDQTVFGPAVNGTYWSSTSFNTNALFAWLVDLDAVDPIGLNAKIASTKVRAVRGGL